MSYSFDIKNSLDLYREFSKQVDDFQNNPMSSGSAVICAILSWHVIEWICQEYTDSKSISKDFRSIVKSECPSIAYMQDVANGSKHMGITRYTPAVKSTECHQGAYSDGYSNGYDISSLRMTLQNGQFIYFNEEIIKAREYIKLFIVEQLCENI